MTAHIKLVFTGGLGNQLFQYATYVWLQQQPGVKVEPYLWSYRYCRHHQGFEVGKIFHTDFDNEIDRVERLREGSVRTEEGEFHRLVRLGWLKARGFRSIYDTTAGTPGLLQEAMRRYDRILLAGYFQTPLFCHETGELLRHQLRPVCFPGRNREILSETEGHRLISLHIRRGDYIGLPRFNVFKDLGYYQRAMEYMNAKVPAPLYLIFSDDPEWVRANLKVKGRCHYVDCNKGEDAYLDLLLMSRCSHNIIANSSFSWWGAWLNSHEDKIVVCPKMWFTDKSSEEMVPAEWVRIDN